MHPRLLRRYRFKLWQLLLPVGFCVGILLSPALFLLAGVLIAILSVVVRDVVRGL